jgi:hypothetical protein
MSGKYQLLQDHLFSRDDSVWQATFAEIEKVVGEGLPDSARKHQAWWANQSSGHSQYWQRAGWQTAKVDVENERLTFLRKEDRRHLVGGKVGRETSESAPLTVAEAKAGLAAQLGIDPSQIEIIIKA